MIENRLPMYRSFCAGVAVSSHEIATAAHCIHEGITPKITTKAGDECHVSTATVDREHDAAIVRVSGCKLDRAFTSKHKLRKGDALIVLGHPLGEKWSASAGILSRVTPRGYLQTDAAINFGNSGGGVFDTHGHLVGIVSYLRNPGPGRGSAGLGFATPIKNCLRLR